MSTLQYKATPEPEHPELTVAVSAVSAQQFAAKVTGFDLTGVTLTPDGDFIDKALEKLAQPLVELVVGKLPRALARKLVGQTIPYTLDHPIGYQVTVEDQSVTLTATDLVLGTHEGHLLATGGIEVGS